MSRRRSAPSAPNSSAYGVRLRPGERRYDIGNFEAYFEAFVAFALADPKFGPALRRHLLDLLHVSHA